MSVSLAKRTGAYFTPSDVAACLVDWVVRAETDRLLDPSCGDGQFLAAHRNSVGVEQDPHSACLASHRNPGAVVHIEDFFQYATLSKLRFDCVAGNPPFIRFQRFSGETRLRALALCESLGAKITSLSSSWAPFVVAASSLLKPGGRLAFVIPAEIGHAPYAAPVIEYLLKSFGRVQLVAIREKVFKQLSQDVWLLYAEDYGSSASQMDFNAWDRFRVSRRPPKPSISIDAEDLRSWGYRLRPYLLDSSQRELYAALKKSRDTMILGDKARVSIGYVTGANDFFHLRPSEAKKARIPERFLTPSVLNGRRLSGPVLSDDHVQSWRMADARHLLLNVRPDDPLTASVRTFLDSSDGKLARSSYKCSNRSPWYSVPDVYVPDGFLTYMSGKKPMLVKNAAGCVCTNSLHAVRCKSPEMTFDDLQNSWKHPLAELSAELEGHPLGGGLLKLEPREASRICLPLPKCPMTKQQLLMIREAVQTLRDWRHCG